MFVNKVSSIVRLKKNNVFFSIPAIDRCYNDSGSCGTYGKCINLPLTNSYRCQCRFFYTGDRCEKCKFRS